MSKILLSAIGILLAAAGPLRAQPAPSGVITYPGVITPPTAIGETITQTEPLVVETANPTGAAVSAVNTALQPSPTPDGWSSGLYVRGSTGLVVDGTFLGANFFTPFGVGIEVAGRDGGVDAVCREVCTGVTGRASFLGTGVAGIGTTGVSGVAVPSPPGVPVPSYAGHFTGDVRVTRNLIVEGAVSAPVIEQLEAEVISLRTQLAALAALPALAGAIPRAVPGRIQAEAYNVGGAGIGYVDTTDENEGGVYRSDGVDIKASGEGDYAVGWIMSGEWLAYTVDVQRDDVYTFSARVGSPLPGRTFHIEVDGADVTGPVPVPQVAAWDQYATQNTVGVPIQAGRHVLRIVMGPEDFMDLQWFEVRR